jgi:hypothetical protein
VRDREPDLGQTQHGTELTSAAHEVSCHFPITVQVTGRLSDDHLDQLVAQVVQAVTERIAAAERELPAHVGGHVKVVAPVAGALPTTAPPAAAVAASGRAGQARPAPEGEGVDPGGVRDEFGTYWYTDDQGYTWWRKAAGESWELLAGPDSAIRLTPSTPPSASDIRDARIKAAIADVDLADEKRVIARLAGLEKLYTDIKTEESRPQSGKMKGEFPATERDTELAQAHFTGVADFDNAVRTLRLVVRRRALALTLSTMRASEQVLQDEYARYFSRDECDKLATHLSQPGLPYDLIARNDVLNTHRILFNPVTLRGALETAKSPEALGQWLQASARAQLGNIARMRQELQDHSDVVFELDEIINTTLTQLGLSADSVQAQIIREGRGAPGPPWWRQLIDDLLLVLSFAGPLGLVAQAAQLALAMHDIAASEALQNTAAEAGPYGLASPPVSSAHLGLWLPPLGGYIIGEGIKAAATYLLSTKAGALVSDSLTGGTSDTAPPSVDDISDGLQNSEISGQTDDSAGLPPDPQAAATEDAGALLATTPASGTPYDQLSFDELHSLAPSDRAAAEALLRRYEAMSRRSLSARTAHGDAAAEYVLLRQPNKALTQLMKGHGTFSDPVVYQQLAERLKAARKLSSIPRKSASSVVPGIRTEGGTIGVAVTDAATETQAFIGSSSKAGGTLNPGSEFTPATDRSLLQHTHGHAEQGIADQLDAALSEISPQQREGTTVWMLIEQEVCSTCAQGIHDPTLEPGVLRKLSQKYPEITFEIKNADSSRRIRLRGGLEPKE